MLCNLLFSCIIQVYLEQVISVALLFLWHCLSQRKQCSPGWVNELAFQAFLPKGVPLLIFWRLSSTRRSCAVNIIVVWQVLWALRENSQTLDSTEVVPMASWRNQSDAIWCQPFLCGVFPLHYFFWGNCVIPQLDWCSEKRLTWQYANYQHACLIEIIYAATDWDSSLKTLEDPGIIPIWNYLGICKLQILDL